MSAFHTTPIIEQPRRRSPLRKLLGREYHVVRRKLHNSFGQVAWASERSGSQLPHEVFEHQSFLLRPLQDVEMYLQHNKVTNLRLAIDRIDGIMIRPGETFSVWRQVGRPTAGRGFLEGLVLDSGRISKGIGGGLCQLGNLLYWTALHSPLTIAERWRHSYDVFPDVNRTIPFGAGATLAYNYVDLALRNETEATYQINLRLSETHLHGSISSDAPKRHSYRVFESDHRFHAQWWGGYTRHNRIWRDATDIVSGETQVEFITENHAVMMYEPLLPESSS